MRHADDLLVHFPARFRLRRVKTLSGIVAAQSSLIGRVQILHGCRVPSGVRVVLLRLYPVRRFDLRFVPASSEPVHFVFLLCFPVTPGLCSPVAISKTSTNHPSSSDSVLMVARPPAPTQLRFRSPADLCRPFSARAPRHSARRPRRIRQACHAPGRPMSADRLARSALSPRQEPPGEPATPAAM